MNRNKSRSSLQQAPAILLAGILCGATASMAQPPQAPTLKPPAVSLEVLVAEVLAGNPELGFYRAEIAAATGERQTAGGFANPEVGGAIGNKRISLGPLVSDGLVWSVSVKQTFDWPGRMPLRKAIADQQIKLAELGLAQFQAALGARARTLAFSVFATQEKSAAAREVAERFQALREVLVQRDPAGLTPVLETRIIEATELTLRRKATEASLAEQAARLELNQLRGQPWEQALRIEAPTLVFPPFPGTEPLLAAARANNFEIRMRRAELEQQGFRISLAGKEKNPSFTVEPYFSQERTGDKETQVGIALSIPLPAWNRGAGRVATEEARRLQAESSLQVAQRNLEREVIASALAYETRLGEMARWRPDSVRQFKEAAAVADRHYRLGAVPIATYVELQKQYLEAVEALLSTRLETLEAAQELERLTGVDMKQLHAAAPVGRK
jgi:cobalt-zinc-cadmium efflux system outer membrane protein